jgi:parallel beta-helix repeat protein
MFAASPAFATDWYVDGKNGNDKHAGTSSATAFLTPAHASAIVQPGDTIHFLPTTIYNQLFIMKSGTASAPITLQGDGVSPNLTQVTGSGVGFGLQVNQGASYIVVKNFDIVAPGPWNSIYVGTNSTHVTLTGNLTHDSGYCGIGTTHADYLTITNNVVYNNGKYTALGVTCSGIGTYEDNNSDTYTGIKNVISGNVIYNNTNVPTSGGATTDADGSGIILDDLRHTQSDNAVYNGKTLIENNLIFNNGGRGIYVYISDHAIITNNTVYFNNRDPYEGSYNPGEIMVEGGGGDVQIYNNIAYSDGLAMNSTSTHMALSVEDATDGNGTVTADYNLLYNTQGNAGNMYYAGTTTAHTNTNTVTFGSHNLWLDPQFVSPSINPAIENFLLQDTSPGRGTAYVAMAATTAITGAARPTTNIDMGAYQQVSIPVCGTSNNTVLTAAPSANLCAVGSSSSVTGSGPWSWTCSSGSDVASCQALTPTLAITITASGDYYQGSPNMALYVNGILEGQTLVTALHSANQWQTFTYNMMAPASLQSIVVGFTNDLGGAGGDRNLYVKSITVNGVNYNSTQAAYTHWGTTQAGQMMMYTTGTLTWTGTPLTGSCGASNGILASVIPSTNLCSVGTASAVTGSGPWGWTCAGLNGGGNASCSASKLGGSTPIPVNGTCGASNATTLSSAPASGLCGTGNASSVTGSGPWAWTCAGISGGSTASCSANLAAPAPVNGTCGASDGTTLSSVPTANLCSIGSATSVTGSGPWAWTCSGANGGSTASCSANLAPPPVNASCGTSNAATLSSIPTTNLCGIGSASSVTGSGPWAWTCSGANGGTNASCAANLAVSAPTPINASCGVSNGLTLSKAPTASLCILGTATSVTGSGPWAWTCSGANGGTNSSCSANLAVTPLTVTVVASGDDYNGDPIIGLIVNGVQTTSSTVTAVHSLGQWQTFTYTVTPPSVLSNIGVRFTNDAYGLGGDRNLYIKSVTVNGVMLMPNQGIYTHWGASQTGSVILWTTGTLTWNASLI